MLIECGSDAGSPACPFEEASCEASFCRIDNCTHGPKSWTAIGEPANFRRSSSRVYKALLLPLSLVTTLSLRQEERHRSVKIKLTNIIMLVLQHTFFSYKVCITTKKNEHKAQFTKQMVLQKNIILLKNYVRRMPTRTSLPTVS